jgi:1-acyl-sn-glycerol-3-phosphate acyltransferase
MYWVFKGTVLRVLRIWFRPKVDGARNVPAGPAIIASNHLSFSDTFFLGAVVSRRLTFLAKSSYFNTPGVKGWLTARFFRGLGQVPIDRVGGTASETALDAGTEVLRLGGTIVPKTAPLSICIGEPLHFSCRAGLSPDQELRRVTDEVMQELRRLSGQEYVDSYSPGPLKPAATQRASGRRG